MHKIIRGKVPEIKFLMQFVDDFEKIVFKWFVMRELLLVFGQSPQDTDKPIYQDVMTLLL